MLQDITSYAAGLFPAGKSTEFRYQENRNRAVSLVSGNLSANTRSEQSGISARVCDGGVYGFASMADDSEESVKAVLRAAAENAAFMARRAPKAQSLTPAGLSGNFACDCAVPDPEQKAYVDFAREVDAYILAHCPRIISRVVAIRADSMEKELLVSSGLSAHTILARCYVYVFLTAEGPDGAPVEVFHAVGGEGTLLGRAVASPADVYPEIDKLYEKLMKKAEGIHADAGLKTCILGGTLAGMLAHEAVGHTVEADLVLGGSVAAHSLGKVVASPLVSLVDYAHTAFGKPTPLPVYVDDEGVLASDAEIIRSGTLVGYMNNRETAARFGMLPQGNARAYAFSDEPLIRMRNTAILPGHSTIEEMIASVEDGYYLTDTNNGQADTTGEFMFGISMGYEIKNGKLGRALLDTTITGVAFEMLKTVDMVGDTVEWSSSGFCGKKQRMPVGLGGPALRCRVTIGGR